MLTKMALASVFVRDYDEALKWYTEVLGLEPRTDISPGGGYRFLTVAVPGQDVEIVLHIPDGKLPEDYQGGMGHGFVFHTDDCRADVERLRQKGVKITLEPQEMPWGIQARFDDLYGNDHVLLQPAAGAGA